MYRLLLLKGMEYAKMTVNSKTSKGFTPLMMAAKFNKFNAYITIKFCGGYYISDTNFSSMTVRKILK